MDLFSFGLHATIGFEQKTRVKCNILLLEQLSYAW